MGGTSFGRTALTAAWVGGGAILVGFAAWNWTGTAEQARLVRLGVVWAVLGVVTLVSTSPRYRSRAERRDAGWSRLRSGLLGLGLALALVGFVLSGTYLVAFGAGGLLLVAVAFLADA